MAEVQARTVAMDAAAAVAEAVRQVDPDVLTACPQPPQAAVLRHLARPAGARRAHAEPILLESERAALSICVGASAAGARAMALATSQGLASMGEELHLAASMRLPIVMPVAGRMLSAWPAMHCGLVGPESVRDVGCIQIDCAGPQEAYDGTLQAVRIAEHPDVLTPVIVVCEDVAGGRAVEQVDLLTDAAARGLVGEYRPEYALLGTGDLGLADRRERCLERQRQQIDALTVSMPVIQAVGDEFGRRSDRFYGVLETLGMDDAELVLVAMGAAAAMARSTLGRLRQEGLKAGLVRPRVFRPFPAQELADALRSARAVGVLDRPPSFGAANGYSAGPLYFETAAALFAAQNREARVLDYVFGLGGHYLARADVEQVVADLEQAAATGSARPAVRYLGWPE